MPRNKRKQKPKKAVKKAKGAAANYMSRNQALRKLQLSLPAFRRLCILKGIYPREPNSNALPKNKTYYYTKDIQFLLHEPIINTIRQTKIHKRRIAKARGKRDKTALKHLIANKPKFTLHHIVKERYPSFVDALRDLDDCLCLVFLFATLPTMKSVPARVTAVCKQLSLEFLRYVTLTRCLKKTFLSIKGIYYQVEIMNTPITWVVPYQFATNPPQDVDYRIMLTFTDFYETLLRFVHYRLYTTENLAYPPHYEAAKANEGAGLGSIVPVSLEEANSAADSENKPSMKKKSKNQLSGKALEAVNATIAAAGDDDGDDGSDSGSDGPAAPAVREDSSDGEGDEDDEAAAAELRALDRDAVADADTPQGIEAAKEAAREHRRAHLFDDAVIFLSREVPKESIEFIVMALGGKASWSVTEGGELEETDNRITHQISDRPKLRTKVASREYVQPQWVYDSVNAGFLLPTDMYAPGKELPPHLSPFVEYVEGEDAIPEQVGVIERLRAALEGEEDSDDYDSDDDRVDSDDEEDVEEQYARELAAEAAAHAEGETAGASIEEAAISTSRARKKRKREEEAEEAADAEEMSKIMMPRKHRRLAHRIDYTKRKKQAEKEKLEAKRVASKERKAKRQRTK